MKILPNISWLLLATFMISSMNVYCMNDDPSSRSAMIRRMAQRRQKRAAAKKKKDQLRKIKEQKLKHMEQERQAQEALVQPVINQITPPPIVPAHIDKQTVRSDFSIPYESDQEPQPTRPTFAPKPIQSTLQEGFVSSELQFGDLPAHEKKMEMSPEIERKEIKRRQVRKRKREIIESQSQEEKKAELARQIQAKDHEIAIFRSQEKEEDDDYHSSPQRQRRKTNHTSTISSQRSAIDLRQARKRAEQFIAKVKRTPNLLVYGNKLHTIPKDDTILVDFSLCKDDLDNSFLHTLIINHNQETADVYLNLFTEAILLGADKDAQNKFGHTPLWLALFQKKVPFVWMLTSYRQTAGVNPNLCGYLPKTIYKTVGWFKKTTYIDIDRNVDLSRNPVNPLDLVEIVITEYNKQITTEGEKYWPRRNDEKIALWRQELTQFTQIERMLLDAGAQKNTQNLTPLHQAAQNNDIKKIIQFIKAGHNPQKQDIHGRRPVDVAPRESDAYNLLRLGNSALMIDEGEECTLCLDVFESGQAVTQFKECNHFFHSNPCFGQLMNSLRPKSADNQVCPLCRKNINHGHKNLKAFIIKK